MQLWSGSLKEFVREAEAGALTGSMLAQYFNYRGAHPSQGETDSWKHSLPVLARTLSSLSDLDVGVVLEYQLPYSFRRPDVVLLGEDQADQGQALVLELKQWSAVESVDDTSENILVANVPGGNQERAHPSQQARDYADTVASIHSACTDGDLGVTSCAYCHNLGAEGRAVLLGHQFNALVARSPLFARGDEARLAEFVDRAVGRGGGQRLLATFIGGHFRPSRKLLAELADTLEHRSEWHLLDVQRDAYNAILAEVRKRQAVRGRSAILVSGGPGTGKSVIAIQLLATSGRLGFTAAHSTGGRAFTTVLKSKLKAAQELFIGNINLRGAASQGLDLLLVDEAHRIRETSDTRFTPAAERNLKAQTEELLDAARVTVFFLDENQFMRPDEIGCAQLIRDWTAKLGVPLKEFHLTTQFRCNGCLEYVGWVDHLLGYTSEPLASWGGRYRVDLVDSPQELERGVANALAEEQSARLVAGFCWPWSEPNADGSLVHDVTIGTWSAPWNRKAKASKSYPPDQHPYTLWAETPAGERQVGVTYSAQGFEFDHVGVIWGTDLLWRNGAWVADRTASYDRPVKARTADTTRLLRNAYRVLLTRGQSTTQMLILDPETRDHLRNSLANERVPPPLVEGHGAP